MKCQRQPGPARGWQSSPTAPRRRPGGGGGPLVDALESRRLMCYANLIAGMPGLDGQISSGTPLMPGAAVSTFLPAADVQAAANAPLPGLPVLNSLPGAPTAIYLDFNGNADKAAYDEDGNPAAFGAAEQVNIREAWRQVSAYFAPFRVNVTTALPSGVPTAWDLVSPSISPVGYSYVNVFPNGSTPQSFNPAGDARTRQSGIAHELGHNFGLSHQGDFDPFGNLVNEYSSGFDATHGPIMGVDYAQNVHKWFIGHPSYSPSVLQDDIAVISAAVRRFDTGGDGFRPDDYANTTAAATPLTADAGVQRASGLIERMADVDAFSFVAPGGRVSLDVNPTNPSGLAPKVEVYDASGRLVAARDDTDQRDGGNNGLQFTLDLPAGSTYYLTVASHGDYGDLGLYDVSLRPLPAGWDTTDLGQNGVAGAAGYDAATGTYTITGSGGDIWNSADQARFAYTTLSGDGTIVARVGSMQNTGQWAKVGLDVRESPTANARHVGMVASYSNGSQFLWRASTGGASNASTTTAAPFAPVWLKLTRAGNTFTGYRSFDNVNWTVVGSTTVSMAQNVYVGLIANAYTNARANTATIDNLSINGNVNAPPPAANGLPAPTGLAVAPSPAGGTGLDLRWDAAAGATGYAVERSVDGVRFARVATTAGNVTAYSNGNLFGSMRYFYRVTAADAGGGSSAPSAVAAAVNRPGTVGGLSVTSVGTSQLVVNWRDVSGDAGYRVERSADGGTTYQPLATVGANVPSYTDNGVISEVTYTYRVTPLSPVGDGVPATAVGATRLPAVTGLAFTERAPDRLSFRWNALASATGYRVERATDGVTFAKVADLPQGTTAYTDTNVSPLSEYEYRVVGYNARTESAPGAVLVGATPDDSQLPAPWQSADLGGGGAGATGYAANGTFTLLAGGRDIWDQSDQLRFTYQPLAGDGYIVARVGAVERTDVWAKVGVMVRESLTAGSKHATVVVTPGNGVQMQYRDATNGASGGSGGTGGAAPYWVKLVRTGATLTGYASPDGNAWTQVGTVSISMANTVYVGLAATAHNAGLINTSTVTDVSVSNAAPTLRVAPAANPNPVAGRTASLSVLGADDHGESNLTYAWSVAGAPVGGAVTFSAANDTNAAKNTTATFTRAGVYTLTATVTDSGGLTFTTNPLTVTVSQTATSIDVAPPPVVVHTGGQYPFRAVERDQFGDPMTVQPAFTWSVTGAGNSVAPTGVVTAGARAGAYAVRAADGSLAGAWDFTVWSAVAGRYVFYNNSAYDGRDPAATAADDAAVAPDKQPLLPGQTATFANVTSYTRGINGVIIDIAGLPLGAALVPADFDVNSSTAKGPQPSQVTVRPGPGGTDRVTLVWPDGAIRNQWINVALLPTAHTGLAAADRFAFGNLVGDTGSGNAAGGASVTNADVNAVRYNLYRQQPIDGRYDFDRDGRVTVMDWAAARQSLFASLPLYTAPAAVVSATPLAARRIEATRASSAAAALDDAVGQ